jgi:hypothetical protein
MDDFKKRMQFFNEKFMTRNAPDNGWTTERLGANATTLAKSVNLYLHL